MAVNNEAGEAEDQSVVSAQSAVVEETEVHESEEKKASEPQNIVISKKPVTIAEQMAKVSQKAEQSADDAKAVGGTKDPTTETPEE